MADVYGKWKYTGPLSLREHLRRDHHVEASMLPRYLTSDDLRRVHDRIHDWATEQGWTEAQIESASGRIEVKEFDRRATISLDKFSYYAAIGGG